MGSVSILGQSCVHRSVPLRTQTSEEGRLVAAAKRGCKAAFEELCRPHTGRLLHMTMRITRNQEDSEDALQDSLMRGLAHIKNFDGRSSFSTWLTRIATNSALMILRKKRAARELALEGQGEDGNDRVYEIRDGRPDPEKQYEEQERAEMLYAAIAKLRPKLKRVVELQQLQEHSLEETAKVLAISVTATKGRLFHARAALRNSPRFRVLRQKSEHKTSQLSAA